MPPPTLVHSPAAFNSARRADGVGPSGARRDHVARSRGSQSVSIRHAHGGVFRLPRLRRLRHRTRRYRARCHGNDQRQHARLTRRVSSRGRERQLRRRNADGASCTARRQLDASDRSLRSMSPRPVFERAMSPDSRVQLPLLEIGRMHAMRESTRGIRFRPASRRAGRSRRFPGQRPRGSAS